MGLTTEEVGIRRCEVMNIVGWCPASRDRPVGDRPAHDTSDKSNTNRVRGGRRPPLAAEGRHAICILVAEPHVTVPYTTHEYLTSSRSVISGTTDGRPWRTGLVLVAIPHSQALVPNPCFCARLREHQEPCRSRCVSITSRRTEYLLKSSNLSRATMVLRNVVN